MHKRYVVELDKDERKELSQRVKKEKIAAKKRTPAQVLLLADCGRQQPAPAKTNATANKRTSIGNSPLTMPGSNSNTCTRKIKVDGTLEAVSKPSWVAGAKALRAPVIGKSPIIRRGTKT